MKTVWQFLFLVVAVVAIGFVLWIFPMIRADLPRRNFQKNLKARTSAEALHTWATQILAPYQTNDDAKVWMEISHLPAAFRGLDKAPPTAWVRDDSQVWFQSSNAMAYIRISYGSAAGHFGVLLGPTNLPTPPNREHEIQYTTWKPGIWFFDGQ